jgi:hypothetical protein
MTRDNSLIEILIQTVFGSGIGELPADSYDGNVVSMVVLLSTALSEPSGPE